MVDKQVKDQMKDLVYWFWQAIRSNAAYQYST